MKFKSLLGLFLSLVVVGCRTSDPAPSPVFAPAVGRSLSGYWRTVVVDQPIRISGYYDGSGPGGKKERYLAGPGMGDGSQREDQKPLFVLSPGATLRNVILDDPAADGIHVHGAAGQLTRVIGVEFRDVGEDAVTVKSGGSDARVEIRDCLFLQAADKVIQVNAAAHTLVVDCYFRDFQRAVRGCGTCGNIAYRIEIRDCDFVDGRNVLKLSNPKARGKVSRIRLTRVSHPLDVSGGAQVTKDW